MATKTAICNFALRHLAHGKLLLNVETDRTPAANVMRQWYDQVIEEVLRDFWWPFAMERDDLALVETSPNDDWAYSYRYPSGCVFFRFIPSGATRKETLDTAVPFAIGQDATGKLIFTDAVDAEGVWTKLISDPAMYAPDFVQMVALLLAAYAGPSITGGDEFKLAERALKMYAWAQSRAQKNAANEQQRDPEPDAALIRARNG